MDTLVRRVREAIKRIAASNYKKDRLIREAEALDFLEELEALVKSSSVDTDLARQVAIAKLLTSIKPSRLFPERRYYVADPKNFEDAVDELKKLYSIEEIVL